MNTLFFLGVTFGSYYLMAIIQTLLHRAFGHKDRIHPVYSAHALGHHAKYDGAEMQGDSYIDSEVHVMYYFAFPIAAVAAVAYLAGGVLALTGNLVGVVAAFWWHLHLHEQYHLIDSYLERFAWFQKNPGPRRVKKSERVVREQFRSSLTGVGSASRCRGY